MQKFHKNKPSIFNFSLKSMHFHWMLTLIFIVSSAYLCTAQLTLPSDHQSLFPQKNTAPFFRAYTDLQFSFYDTKFTSNFLKSNLSASSSTFYTNPELPKAYCFKDLALFCKIEVQLEKMSKIPIKFRLGSVDYVDKLEAKR